ncbi:MAG TPA: LLM class flavin-dependent oxidoreductase [Acidimicrobiales bacterium]|nr:LLM class flavin-dependent oxidoreductase [Acidimicrobiales bacterium]
MNAPVVRQTVATALRAEADGWDGITFGDSQNLVGDGYVEMALAAAATSRIKLATWVTNPFTRHAATTASAAATLQVESQGRIEISIGRGDSALAHLGLAPAPIAAFAAYVEQVQRYLRGEDVPFSPASSAGAGFRSVATLGLGVTPDASRLRWLPTDLPKVPLFVGATGPKVMTIGAASADGVIVSVGSERKRVAWAIDTIRSVERDDQQDAPVVGVHVPVAVHHDRAVARKLVASKVATHARFSIMNRTVAGPVTDGQRRQLETIRSAYDMNNHARHDTSQTAVLTDDIVDTYAIAGPPSYCIERIGELAQLGCNKLLINTVFPGTDPDAEEGSRRRLVDAVLPALR